MKLQQATLMFIVTQLTSKQEKEELEKTFKALDKNGDGKLSRQELIDGYTQTFKSEELAKAEVDKIMKEIDVDNNGYIEYSEFLLASCNKKKALSTENLKTAFNMFDQVSIYFEYF